MLRLLQIEFIKLWNNNASRVLIISYFVLILCMALLAAIKFDIGPIQFHVAEQGIFNFPYIWHLNTWIASGLKLFFAIIIVSMMANEYSNKTLKFHWFQGFFIPISRKYPSYFPIWNIYWLIFLNYWVSFPSVFSWEFW